ncbi:uncharacterized protein [Hetaerina americana]|uniref:uncharacterized protein n=1 Tax=Hetaerina americana TaxID=62018 RepID=UPI003A7F54D8
MSSSDPNIVKSLYPSGSKSVPDVSITDFLFQSLDINYELLKDQIWVKDVFSGSSYKYSDIKPLTRKIASGLTRLGFKKGDVFCFATNDVTLIYLVHLSVWICGGVLRGLHPQDEKEVYERQLREVSCRFTLCDHNTKTRLKWAIKQLEWDVQELSIGGKVEGATAIEHMVVDDNCSCYPHDVQINPKEDVYIMVSTSGSTGFPKCVLHTHYNMVACYSSFGAPIKIEEPREVGMSAFTMTGNHLISAYGGIAASILYGCTFQSSSNFELKTLLPMLEKHKPETLFLYPYAANVMMQSDELGEYDLSSLKYVFSGGSVFTPTTAKLFEAKLPNVKLMTLFGMSEILFCTFSSIDKEAKPTTEKSIAGLAVGMSDGCEHISCGQLLPAYQAKIVDPLLKCSVGRNTKGQLWVKGPYMMKGYLDVKSEKGYISKIDEDGWFNTGDMGYIDKGGNLYVVDRSAFTFIYNNHLVSPSDIEAIIMRHQAVSIAGVIGVPDFITTASARAYVVLKPNYKVTEEDIKKYVAERACHHMHLHGGVVILDELPECRGGKINRPALFQMAQAERKL